MVPKSPTSNTSKMLILGLDGDFWVLRRVGQQTLLCVLVTSQRNAVLCLRCLQCIGTSSSCRMVVRTCASYETSCISIAYRSQGDSNTVMKGCSTTYMCNQTSIIDTGTRSVYMTSTCCESNFCNINRYSTSQVYMNRLQCNSCPSSSVGCSSSYKSIFCDEVSNYCVNMATKEWKNGVLSTSSNVLGCGSANIGETCTNLFAFNTGSYERYSYFSCCNTNRCNTASQQVPKLTNNNGISCFGCLETGKNECAVAKQVSVQCKGTLIRCMEVFDKNRTTIMKGCSTVTFCSSTYPSQEIPNVSEIQCCAGSYCNNFTRETNTTTDVISSSTRLNTDLRLPAFLIGLIYAIMRHFP
ncbi:urokinase plasminogen activator surface receptor-like [Dendrobates tinctorius]|uniref:urokinase plasminogen activator surface receptor-like n=1 Tax=Dendrobates tinctorius TaxID=92724 RepID=UPI003CC9F4D8